MITPKVNNNGTSREELIQQRIRAREAVIQAIRVMSEMRPHGRDYLGDTETYHRDRVTHDERIAVLDKLYCELLDEAVAITNS
jgi:hypothetical protein